MPRVFDLIKPLDNRDTYAITDVFFQKGGLREVETVSAMNLISSERRRNGMIVFITQTAEFYSLTGGDLTNSSWEKIDFSNNLENSLNIKELITSENTNSISETAGNNLSITVSDTSILKLKDGSSVVALQDVNIQDGKILFLQNLSENEIIIKNNYFESLNTSLEFFNDLINLRNCAFSSNKFLIVSNSGMQASRIIESTNAETWSYLTDIPNNDFEDILYADEIFIAIASSGNNRVLVSEDGTNWDQILVELNSWRSITFGNNLFVAVASDGDDRVMYSSNGSSWTDVTVELNSWRSITFGNNRFVAVSDDGDNRIMYSSNAVTWTNIESPTQNEFFKVKFLNNKFYAVSDLDVIVSDDGIEWEVLSLPFSSENIKDIFFYDYFLFIKNNIIYYTNNFEKWKSFSFTNTSNISNTFFYNNYYYLICDSRILRIKLDLIQDDKYPILTGNNKDIELLSEASVLLQFSHFENAWRVVGSVIKDLSFIELDDTPTSYPLVAENNNLFLSVNPNQSETEKIIFNNPFPVVENTSEDLVIKNINTLRIRKFDNATGEIVFAKFEPTFTIIMDTPINFDDEIDYIGVSVTNDSFLENNKVLSIINLSYYKNNQINNILTLTPNEQLPTINNTNFTWSSSFTFDTIQDENSSFGISPNAFNFLVAFLDNNSNNFTHLKNVTYTSPFFTFSAGSKIQDFRTSITSCNLLLTYGNVTDKNNNSEITSITSTVPNNPTYTGFTNGMTSYTATGILISETDVTKTNNLSDSTNYTFTTVCKYTRPSSIDPENNFFNITSTANFSVTFTYPIFVGTTSSSVTSLEASDIDNLTDMGSVSLPRSFNYTVGNSNVNWWFCIRKRYINNRTPTVLLSSDGFSANTTILDSNEVEINTYADSETYVCYYILLQENNSYSINISI